MECAATAPGGFAKDEPYLELGTHMLLPPWFEHRRAEIMAMLEPITVPEYNDPMPAVTPANVSRRTSAEFIPTDKK